MGRTRNLFLMAMTALAMLVVPTTMAQTQDAAPSPLQQASTLMMGGQLEEALAAYDMILKSHFELGPTWFQRGMCLRSMGRLDEAITSFDRCVEVGFAPMFALFSLTTCAASQGDLDRAFAALNEAVDRHGYGDLDQVMSVSVLAELRADPRFKTIRWPVFEPPPNLREVNFSARDGQTVYGHLYALDENVDAPVALLFHQGGSNAAEYVPIAPKLNAMGMHALAVDVRDGNMRWGRRNRTAREFGRIAELDESFLDLVAARDFMRGRGFTGPLIIWGSSYTAGLAVKFAAEQPEGVAAVLAFSPPPPGNPFMGDAYHLTEWANAATAPMLLHWAPQEYLPECRALAGSLAEQDVTIMIPEVGVHGSSTLREDLNPEGAAANWAALTKFLSRLVVSDARR